MLAIVVRAVLAMVGVAALEAADWWPKYRAVGTTMIPTRRPARMRSARTPATKASSTKVLTASPIPWTAA